MKTPLTKPDKLEIDESGCRKVEGLFEISLVEPNKFKYLDVPSGAEVYFYHYKRFNEEKYYFDNLEYQWSDNVWLTSEERKLVAQNIFLAFWDSTSSFIYFDLPPGANPSFHKARLTPTLAQLNLVTRIFENDDYLVFSPRTFFISVKEKINGRTTTAGLIFGYSDFANAKGKIFRPPLSDAYVLWDGVVLDEKGIALTEEEFTRIDKVVLKALEPFKRNIFSFRYLESQTNEITTDQEKEADFLFEVIKDAKQRTVEDRMLLGWEKSLGKGKLDVQFWEFCLRHMESSTSRRLDPNRPAELVLRKDGVELPGAFLIRDGSYLDIPSGRTVLFRTYYNREDNVHGIDCLRDRWEDGDREYIKRDQLDQIRKNIRMAYWDFEGQINI